MNSCDTINKIHASFDEKIFPEHAKQAFSLVRWVDTISVYRCLWSNFKVIDKYERIIKAD
jgi:hypothetical protein